jgi:hypothetical protein
MWSRRLEAFSVAVLALLAAACGTSSGGIEPEPAETLIYVTGGTGLEFELNPTDTTGCEDQGSGIQGPTSNHQFPGRIFRTPHLFVLENARQPVQMVVRNLSDIAAVTVTITIGTTTQVLGANPGDPGFVDPGTCKRVGVAPTVSPTPRPGQPNVAIEVCAPLACDECTNVDTNIPCVAGDGEPDPVSSSISFFASVGDIRQSNITNCITVDTQNCLTPATFFIERPKDQVASAMTVQSGQAPGNGQIRTELYINGHRTDSAAGGNPILRHNF